MTEKEIRNDKPEFVVDIPLEARISREGVHVESLIYTTSPEALDKYHEECEKQGGELVSSRELKSEKEVQDVVNKASKSFGFTRWNSPWNPEGPRPNWAKPENASNN